MSAGAWIPARIASTRRTNAHAVVLQLEVPGWPGNQPGAHLDVRLTAADGYQAERSYSLASSGDAEQIEIAVDRVDGGEVSTYLVDEARAGDAVEIKGPLGRYFIWDENDPAPVQLVAGGSGIVPLLGIARARAASSVQTPFRLLYSVRSPADAMYVDEVHALAARGIDVTWVYTRSAPDAWGGRVGRMNPAVVQEHAWPHAEKPTAFVCGPTGFVEYAADLLVRFGYPPVHVKTERFGGA